MKNTLKNKILFAPVAYLIYCFQLLPWSILLMFICCFTPIFLMMSLISGNIETIKEFCRDWGEILFYGIRNPIHWHYRYWVEFKFDNMIYYECH